MDSIFLINIFANPSWKKKERRERKGREEWEKVWQAVSVFFFLVACQLLLVFFFLFSLIINLCPAPEYEKEIKKETAGAGR